MQFAVALESSLAHVPPAGAEMTFFAGEEAIPSTVVDPNPTLIVLAARNESTGAARLSACAVGRWL
jgi:hypothetical protein